MSTSNMPARIWAGPRTGWTADRTALFEKDTVYIRADIVEGMAEALADISTNSHHPWSARIASAALNSYREADHV